MEYVTQLMGVGVGGPAGPRAGITYLEREREREAVH